MISQTVSVCLLTYNHAHLIETTLKSIQQQTLSDFELIVSDDCSTDGTWEILERLASQDSRIRPFRTPKNLGMAENANFAVSKSSRPFIALLHHDDLCRADLLQKWLAVIQSHDEVAFVFNDYGVENSLFVWHESLPSKCVDGRWFLETRLFPRWGCPVRGTAMIRREAWVAVNGMRAQFGLLADIDLWMRLAMNGSVGYVDEPVMILRHNRPEDYPEEYKSTSWSWPRQRFLYEIHAINRLSYFNMKSIEGRLKWCKFRIRLSLETFKWLTYAVVRNKNQMIKTSIQSYTPYDLLPLRIYRRFLQNFFK